MLPLLAEISVATPMISIYIYIITIVGAILSVISSALSTFGFSVFIPAALAVSGAIAAWGSYHQLEQKLFKKNVAAHQLRCVSKVSDCILNYLSFVYIIDVIMVGWLDYD